MANDTRSSVTYVVQKAPPASQEPIELQLVAELCGVKELAPESTWKLKNGVTVAGRVYETTHEGLLKIWTSSNAKPQQVFVRLEDFSETDQAKLKGLMSKPGSWSKYEHLPLIAFGIKRWNGTPPRDTAIFRQIVAVEDGQIFARADRELYAAPESAVDPAEVAELKQQFKAVGSGRYLEVAKFTRARFAGKLIAENDDYFVLETREPNPAFGFRYPKGTRYRMPKHLMSNVLIEQLRANMKQFANELANEKFSPADFATLPSARLVSGGLILCNPITKPDADTVEVLHDEGSRQTLALTQLACTDRVELVYEALVNSGKSPGNQLREAALMAVADDLAKQGVWQLKHAHPFPVGTPLGAIDDGFVLAANNGTQPLFVKASQLEEVDRKLLQLAFQQDRYKWLFDIDPKQLFQSRLIVIQQSPQLTIVDTKVRLDGAIKGEFAFSNADIEAGMHKLFGVHVDSLIDAGDASVYIEKYAPLLASNNRAAALAKIAAMRQTPQDSLPDISQHVPVTEREAWELGNNQATVFQGALAGKWGDDFVFSDEFKGKKKYFLAASSDLSDDSRERADDLAVRMPAQDWEKVVARAENGQYYRIWYDAKRKRILSLEPCVFLEPRSFGPALQGIDGETHTTLWAHVGGEEEGKALIEGALRQGLANLEKAEQGIPKWTFKDCAETLAAHFVAEYGEDILLRDVHGTEFLMFKMNLDEPSLKQLVRLAKDTQNQRQLTQAQRYELPRMWCSYSELLGPAQLTNYVELSRTWLQVKNKDQTVTAWDLSSLTRREQLAAKALWLRQSQQLDDDRSFDALLSQPIANHAKISKTPNLLPAIQQRIDKAWQDHTSELVWQSKPIRVDAKASLIAVDRDATCGIVADTDKQWQTVDFASGEVRSVQELFSSAPTFGPWLYRGAEQVWWVADGALKKRQADGRVVLAIPDSKLKVTLADQSGDFESLVLHFSDDSIAKLELGSGRLLPLRPAPGRTMPLEGAQLAASLDGSAVLITQGNTVVTNVFARRPGEAAGQDFVGVARPLLSRAVSRKFAVGTSENSPQLFAASSAVQGVPPATLNLPFVPQQFGFVNLGPGAEEELQSIGKLNDKFSKPSNWAFVYPVSMDGRSCKHQTIEGEFGENVLLAANGAAIVHKRGGAYVISRRPLEVPRVIRREFYDLAQELLLTLDIGQLEAVARYLQQPKFLTHSGYAGETADSFFSLLWLACNDFQPHVGGDRMERARLVAVKMLEKYPESHLARNLLVTWHRIYAWDARGEGYADSVSERGWEIFRAEFQKAQTELKPLLAQPETIAATYSSAIDIAIATSVSIDDMRKLAVRILGGPHAGNAQLHKAVMQYLLPRWHGEAGMSEAYATNVAKKLGQSGGDAIYAKLICDISSFQGPRGPVTVDMDLDLERLFKGTKEYYEKWDDPNVMDLTLLLLYVAKDTDHIEELLRLRAEKRILPGSTARAGWKTYRAIEESVEAK